MNCETGHRPLPRTRYGGLRRLRARCYGRPRSDSRGMLLVKRLITTAVVAVVTVVLSLCQGTSASAAPGGGATIEESPVSIVISSDSCSNLPDGTTIQGTGTLRSITTTKTNADGITTVRNTSHARGTATDQDGNTYVFLYSNEFRVSNSAADPDTYSGLMTDHFSLSGPGPARLSNGFTARFTTNLVDVFTNFEPIHAHGDPIGFPEGSAHCDPL